MFVYTDINAMFWIFDNSYMIYLKDLKERKKYNKTW